MTSLRSRTPRQVIPRWRPWQATAALGEAGSGRVRLEAQDESLRSAEAVTLSAQLYEAGPSLGRASEFLGASLSFDEHPSQASEVAKSLLVATDVPTLMRELALHVTELDSTRERRARIVKAIDSPARIHQLKGILMREPRNAVRWVDLGREYATLNQLDQANHSLRIARLLAPHDRFVLRSTAALLAKQKRYDEAIRHLTHDGIHRSDPWIFAAYVAVADLAGEKPRNLSVALDMVEDNGMSPLSTSELGAAIGTLEYAAGSSRRARRLFRASLRMPTENSLAQVVWQEDEANEPTLTPVNETIARPFEAEARFAALELNWDESASAARQWFVDQPFSRDAATFSSWAACEGEEWKEAGDIARRWLQSNPDDATLLNNLAFACANDFDLDNAVNELVKARALKPSAEERATLTATEGFVLYRAGHPELGRERYALAIRSFQRLQMREHAAKAALMIAKEELLAQAVEAVEAVRRARHLSANVDEPDVCDLIRKVEELSVESPDLRPALGAATKRTNMAGLDSETPEQLI